MSDKEYDVTVIFTNLKKRGRKMEKQECRNICKTMPHLPECTVVAIAYVPFQTDLETYTSEEALCNGTLFPVLNKKFYGGKCCG